MPGCVLRNCKNNSRNVSKLAGITFHRFLRPGHEKYEAWIKFVQDERCEYTWLPTEHTYICSTHFRQEDFRYTKTGRKFLETSAEPTIFPGGFEYNRSASSSPLAYVSEPESNFDSMLEIKLRSDSRNTNEEEQVLNEECNKLKPTEKSKVKRPSKHLQEKNKNITKIVKRLKKKFGISSEIEKHLLEKADIAGMYTKTRNLKNPKNNIQYSPAIRKFALTCNYYSPAAYKYIRHCLGNTLPHPSTVMRWYSSVHAEPGFTDEAFRILKIKCNASYTPVICNLVLDEMALREQKLFRNKKLGNVNFGKCPIESETEELATNTLVFMLVSLTENWKIPVAYFLATAISAETKAYLINICLMKCHDIGITVSSVTFTACPANFQAAEKLGCDFKNSSNLKTYFCHPSTSKDVFIFVDPCHFIKLIRNTLESKKIIYDGEGNPIRWQLLVNLNKLQQNKGLIADKYSRDIHFRNEVMKVKLATQILSSTVAKALIKCDKELRLSTFQNSAPTVNFLNTINDLFEVMNSKKNHSHGYEKPINNTDKLKLFSFLEMSKAYILSLNIRIKRKRIIRLPNRDPRIVMHVSRKKIVETKNKIGFIGAIICIESLKTMFNHLVVNEAVVKYISTYQLSQDHLELFFGCIRRYNGNNNPNALQFRTAYKEMLGHLEVRSSFTGNCIPLDNFSISNTSSIEVINSTSVRNRHDEEEFTILEKELVLDTDYQAESNCDILADRLNNEQLITSMKLAVGYISSYVSRQLTKQLKCEICITSLMTAVKLWHHKLIMLKDMGGLCYSSKAVFKVCLQTENIIRFFIKEKGRDQSLQAKYSHINFIVARTLKTFINTNTFDSLIKHSLQQPSTLNHRTHLIRAIIEQYAKIRLHYNAKTDPEINCTTRHKKFNKLILFERN